MAKPTPKQNFLTTALWIVTIWLMFTLYMQSQKPQNLGAPQKVLVEMRDANLKVLDQTIAHKLYPALQASVKQELNAKRLSQKDADALLMEGAILVADTQLKAGIHWNDTGRFRAAYQTLVPFENKHLDAEVWNENVDLPRRSTDSSKYRWSVASGHDLYLLSVENLTSRNTKDLIWGFIPGGYQLIDFLVKVTGASPAFSYAFAAFLLALLVRAIVFPLVEKQLRFGRQMSQLGPLTSEIREKYKDNPPEQQQRIMALYREYGINPMAGCGPMLLQFPLFLTIYQCMVLYQFEFQKGTFLWINPVTSKATNGLVAPNLGQLDVILIVLYGISMVVSTLLMPVSDPSQIKQQRMIGVGMSVFVTITMFMGVVPVPAAFVLYWTFTNVLATIQSLRAYRLPAPPLVKVNAPGGGVYPTGGGSKWMQKLEELQKQAENQQKSSNNGSQSTRSKGSGPLNGSIIDPRSNKTGTPAKHKPKKRK